MGCCFAPIGAALEIKKAIGPPTSVPKQPLLHASTSSSTHTRVSTSELKVWLGFVKLDKKFPTQRALQELLYGSPTSSAEDADVIAVHFTDLMVTEQSAEDLRFLLRRALRSPGDYIVNEDDRTLVVQYIPAQLVQDTDEGERFISMSVAVHKRNIEGLKERDQDLYSCFPVPVYLTCKSPRKNKVGPGYKSVLAQDVVLHRDGTVLDLVLLGANLDMDDQARQSQLESVERLLKARMRARPFCSLMWGDFNSRLVATWDLRPHMREKKQGSWELLDSGVEFLADMIDDPARRGKLLEKDSLVYSGKDVTGREFKAPACREVMRRLFTLHIDAVHDARVPVPFPSYKCTPLDNVISQALGCQLHAQDVVFIDELHCKELLEKVSFNSVETYFGWKQKGKAVQRQLKADHSEKNHDENLYLQLGWSDGVGIFRGSTVEAELCTWETDRRIHAFDHLPLRSLVSIRL